MAAELVAVVETGGKQFIVRVGDTIKAPRIEADAESAVTLTDVLGGKTVTATVLGEGRAPKVSGRIFRNKTRSSRFPHGHKQSYTALRIESIK